ncbi:hypothetical protein GUJ93_ZPchr0003g16620 [Zizania palustris]|uniref:Uncharacterized protein n=1 Tax=Zizania palustris TaxID=103762 RepID=A0A8J5SUT8_ZIZPA|nr:hypothetical protein GUJ93_ZPchr0003g16620 [Zizania palustris]
MPSPLKERPTGRLGRLLAALRPARGGALPVQTGFPTSLADLVVKNHGRLRKTTASVTASSRRKKRGGEASPSPSPFPSLPPSSQPASPPPPPPSAPAVLPSAQPQRDLPPVEAVRCRHPNGRDFGLGLGLLAVVGVVSLALLVIWSKKVVAVVTVVSCSLFLLESLRSSALSQRQRPAVTKKDDLGGRGYVSPIREAELVSEPRQRSFSDSSRRSEVSTLSIDERSEVGDDSIVAIIGESCEVCDDSSNPKVKAKSRSWRKLIPRKLQKGRKGREADLSASFRSEGNRADAMVTGNVKGTDSSGSRRHGMANQADAVAKSSDYSGSFRDNGDEMENNARPIEIDEPADPAGDGNVGGGIRFPVVVVVAVILVGLVAGKLPAVAFTVLCATFLSSVQRSSCDGGSCDRSFPWRWCRKPPRLVIN